VHEVCHESGARGSGCNQDITPTRLPLSLRCGTTGINTSGNNGSVSRITDRQVFRTRNTVKHHRPRPQASVTERPVVLPPVSHRERTMPQPHKFAPPVAPVGQRRCPKCGLIMLLSTIEPSDEEGCDERTFECTQCVYAETVTVKFR
jgi:hypothetical protein